MNETTTLFDGQKSVGFGKCYETCRTWDWAFEWLFGPAVQEFEQANFQKFKSLGGWSWGEMLKCQIDRRITH